MNSRNIRLPYPNHLQSAYLKSQEVNFGPLLKPPTIVWEVPVMLQKAENGGVFMIELGKMLNMDKRTGIRFSASTREMQTLA